MALLLLSCIILRATASSLRTALIGFLHYWVVNIFQLFLFALVLTFLFVRMACEPALNLRDLTQNNSFIFLADFSLELFVIYCMLNIHSVALQAVLSLNFSLDFLVLLFEFLSLFDQFLNVLLGKPSFVVCYGYFGIL